MEPRQEPYSDGELRGTLYRFSAGDVLAMHDHNADTVHVSFVISGSLAAYGPASAWSQDCGPGTFLSWEPGVPHEFAAKTDAVLLNVIKNPSLTKS